MRHKALSSAVPALGRRRLVMAVPLLGGLAWAWSGRAAALEAAPGAVQGVVLRDRQTLLGTAVDIVVQGPDTAIAGLDPAERQNDGSLRTQGHSPRLPPPDRPR